MQKLPSTWMASVNCFTRLAKFPKIRWIQDTILPNQQRVKKKPFMPIPAIKTLLVSVQIFPAVGLPLLGAFCNAWFILEFHETLKGADNY